MRQFLFVLFATVLSFGQTNTKKASVPATKQDTWQKSKECADQAQKVMADRNQVAVATEGSPYFYWENHYSPRYNRCFISASYTAHLAKDGDGTDYIQLIDAFERSVLANSLATPLGNPLANSTGHGCYIGDESHDCAKAAKFILDHMKN